MQKENFEEYQLVRDELQSLKVCMTNYIGFVLGGSGLVVAGTLSLFGNPMEKISLGVAYIFLSIIISLVLAVLFYKFNSHNRFAGYCLLLNQEQFTSRKPWANEQFFAWEICVGAIRQTHYKNLSKDLWEISESGIPQPKTIISNARKHPFFIAKPILGFYLLIQTLFGRQPKKLSSWNYPLVIVLLFFLLELLFSLIGLFIVLINIENNFYMPILITTISLLIFNTFTWLTFLKKIYELMCGSATISEYCWRFIEFRKRYLQKQGISDYRIITMEGF